jgi:dTDP-4-dehydrorhamnose 3,5-epimerase
MPVERTSIEGLLVVRWDTHGDERGFFRQTYQRSELAAALGQDSGADEGPVFRQGNHSRSGPGVLRGFHAEPWDKLVYVVRGRAFCAVADIRPQSATFGEVATFVLGDGEGDPPGERIRLYLSQGLANSFLTLEDSDYLYDVTDEFRPGITKPAVAWDDPDLAVDWPVDAPILSEADRSNPTLRELFPDHPRFG